MNSWIKKITLLSLVLLGMFTADSATAQMKAGYHRASQQYLNPYQKLMLQSMQAQARAYCYMQMLQRQNAAYWNAVRMKYMYQEYARQQQQRAQALYQQAQAVLEKNPEYKFKPFQFKPIQFPLPQMGNQGNLLGTVPIQSKMVAGNRR
tara:strand:- start:633 stop:1079 length:447 start_codon:yes stop_codon:yes gene_type:complete